MMEIQNQVMDVQLLVKNNLDGSVLVVHLINLVFVVNLYQIEYNLVLKVLLILVVKLFYLLELHIYHLVLQRTNVHNVLKLYKLM